MNQTEETSKVIFSFPRGENEKIQFALRPYKGRYYIDLRLWFQSTPDSPFTPTKKGISFPSSSVTKLKEGIHLLDLACQGLKPASESFPKPEPRSPQTPGPQSSYPRRQEQGWTRRSNGS